MLLYFLSLLAAAAVVAGNDPRSCTTRWLAFFLVSASLGGLAELIHTPERYRNAYAVMTFLNHTLTPYSVLMYALNSCTCMPENRLIKAGVLLLLPVPLTAVFTFAAEDFRLPFGLILAWAGVYYVSTCILLLRAYLRESKPLLKKKRGIAALLLIPTLLAVLFFINVTRVFRPDFLFFPYVAVFVGFSFAAGLWFAFRTGVLGVRLRMERESMEMALKAVSSGTSMLNHTIKNEIGKISISTDNLKASLGKHGEEPAVRESLRIISHAAEHMRAMADRIHRQAQELVMEPGPVSLSVLVEEMLQEHQSLLAKGRIEAVSDFRADPVLQADRVHLKEAVGNLLRNAVEAMPGGGILTISIQEFSGYVMLELTDTGSGIPEHLVGAAAEPFFTTKNRNGNFGLGLTYVYNVMNRIGGELQIVSKEGQGTTASLLFPGKLVIHSNLEVRSE
ncbi:sensor histidine kinase [Paenibacillus gansuensis]|uniref:histidine kinase n=1 Tax=Paenibacillus gansuensis TaxID=306542 RepID=A0ABW5P6W6_9BACL